MEDWKFPSETEKGASVNKELKIQKQEVDKQ